ncbi:Major Facilitator Superfamily protein [Paenibacillus konkukensis]|uniref:Major Facilitator Superfamily protein n=1 Tax=Paenibacillus konkukensis TaxID=2020716 RepID=A0ABY4RRB7_9BACL|nr:Major Facilitator Superfamily protein [Paenibacillus konkukensis]
MSYTVLWRHRFIRAVLISNVLSQIGIWVRNLAVLLFVMEKTGADAPSVSLISVAEYAPIFLFSLIGGVLADRWRRPKRMIIGCDVWSAVSIAGVAAAIGLGSWQAVFAATFVSAVLSQLAQPAGMKLFKQQVSDELAQPCIALLQMLFAVFMVAGPVLGTFVYAHWGIEASLALTGAAFLGSAAVMAFVPRDAALPADEEGSGGASLLRDMAEGIRYTAKKPVLLYTSLSFMAVGLGVGLISPLGVFVITERLGLPADDLQWTMIPYGIGEVLGGWRRSGWLPAGRRRSCSRPGWPSMRRELPQWACRPRCGARCSRSLLSRFSSRLFLSEAARW